MDEGFYSSDTFITKLQSNMNLIPRYNYSNLNQYYNATNNINSIEVYYNLKVTLYSSVNFSGISVTYVGTIPNEYSTFNVNTTYQSLTITTVNNNYSILCLPALSPFLFANNIYTESCAYSNISVKCFFYL
jgi:hypothetical protein